MPKYNVTLVVEVTKTFSLPTTNAEWLGILAASQWGVGVVDVTNVNTNKRNPPDTVTVTETPTGFTIVSPVTNKVRKEIAQLLAQGIEYDPTITRL